MGKRILLIEDEAIIAETIAFNLQKEGYETETASDGESGLELFYAYGPDLIILDLMLPGIDGMGVCRRIRSQSQVPIIMLTAKEGEIDRVLGLEFGADDYITKPFSMRELMARVKTVLRRVTLNKQEENKKFLRNGDIEIDLWGQEVWVKKEKKELTAKEYEVLKMLMSNAGRVLSRDLLLDRIWGSDFYGDPRTVDVHIRWLREKIESDPGKPYYILTVRGSGYKFRRDE
jgi:DNA-binding response OmpR family regulator